MAWANEPAGRGVDADLRRQLGVGDERAHRPLGEVEPFVERRHARLDVVRRQVAEWRQRGGHGEHVRIVTDGPLAVAHGDDPAVRFGRPPPLEQAWSMPVSDVQQSLDNLKLERDAIVLYDALASIEKDERRSRRVPHDRRQRASSRRDLGRASCASRAPTSRRPGPAAAAGPLHHPARPAVRDARRQRPRPGPRGRRGGDLRRPGVAGGRVDRRRRAGACRDLASGSKGRRRGRGAPRGRPSAPIRPAVGRRAERWHRTRAVGHPAGGHLRGERRPREQPVARHGRGRRAAVEPRFILLAGIAGLLAGSFSMAAGEYISMQSQRELYERQIALERAELEAMPERGGGRAGAGSTARRASRRTRRGRSPTASSRTPRLPSTRSSARSWASTRISSVRRWGARAGSFARVRRRRDRAGHPVPLRRRRPRSSGSASSRASSGCSWSGPGSASSPAAACSSRARARCSSARSRRR